MLDLCLASRQLYPLFASQLLEEADLDIELLLPNYRSKDWKEWREPGILFSAADENDPRVSLLLEHGSLTRFQDRPAVLLPDDGQVENRKLIAALKTAAQNAKVDIRESHMVRNLIVENDAAVGVADDKDTFYARKILLCAGAWSSKIGGVPSEISRSVRPVAGQIVQLRGERRVKQVIYSDKCYLVPRRDGRLIVGATVEEVGFQKRVTASGVSKLLQAACALVPELEDAPVESHWAGLRPSTPDGLPMLGTTSLQNLYVATGHGRNGILLAPATAEAMTACLLDTAEVPTAFSPARFVAPV